MNILKLSIYLKFQSSVGNSDFKFVRNIISNPIANAVKDGMPVWYTVRDTVVESISDSVWESIGVVIEDSHCNSKQQTQVLKELSE